MNPNEHTSQPTESIEELDMNEVSSVDDFIRELEAKEKDLHITSDLQIEVEDPEYNDSSASDLSDFDISIPPPASPARVASTDAIAPDVANELSTLKMRVFELRNERNEIQEKSDRRLKDFENYKYRMDRERRGSLIDQTANLATQMLPVLDNLNRAIDAVEDNALSKDPAFKQFFQGIVLVNQHVNEVLGDMGVVPISTLGVPFDPNFHEAVATDAREDLPSNTISEEILRGYRIGNRVIRHSMVRVNQTHPAEPDTVTASADDLELLTSTQTELVDPSTDGE